MLAAVFSQSLRCASGIASIVRFIAVTAVIPLLSIIGGGKTKQRCGGTGVEASRQGLSSRDIAELGQDENPKHPAMRRVTEAFA